jgi:hypothetical protein
MADGEFYTKKRTLPLLRKKGDGDFQYFGRVTDEIATDVSLSKGNLVIRSQSTGTEILRLTEKSETSYEIVIENAFVGDHNMASSVNHFRYYYALIAERAESYEFMRASSNDSPAATDSESLDFRIVRNAHRVAPNTNAPGSTDIPCMPVTIGGGGGGQ